MIIKFNDYSKTLKEIESNILPREGEHVVLKVKHKTQDFEILEIEWHLESKLTQRNHIIAYIQEIYPVTPLW